MPTQNKHLSEGRRRVARLVDRRHLLRVALEDARAGPAARRQVGKVRDVVGNLLQPHPPLGAQARQRLEQLHGAGVQYVLLDILKSLKRPLPVRLVTLTSFARGNGILAVQIHDVGLPPATPQPRACAPAHG